MSRYYEIGMAVGADDVPQTQRTSADGADSIAMANAENVTKGLDAKIEDLARTWKPTGYYTITEAQQIISETMGLVRSAIQAVGDAPRSTGDADTQIKQALDRLYRNGGQALVFVEKLRAAKSGTLVEMKGLKEWVLHSMINASQAFQTTSVLRENLPYVVSLIAAFQDKFDKLIPVIKKAGAIVWDGIQDLIDIPISVAKNLGWGAAKIAAGIAVAAGVGYVVIKRETK